MYLLCIVYVCIMYLYVPFMYLLCIVYVCIMYLLCIVYVWFLNTYISYYQHINIKIIRILCMVITFYIYKKNKHLYTLYPTHNESKAYSHSDYTLLARRLQPNATQVTAKRHYRCALLMLTLGCICGMITVQPHYLAAVTTLAFSLNREPTPVHFVSPTM